MRNRYTSLAIVTLILFAAAAASAQTLTERIDALLKEPALECGMQGILIKSLRTGQTLYERNAGKRMVPASNFKLLVSSTALEKLGPEFTYKTEVLAAGKIDSGVVDGDLVLKGGGDPVLLTADLTDLAAQLKAAGIAQVKGGIIADDTYFDDQRLGWGWSWDYTGSYFAAEISALTLNRNTVDVWVTPGKEAGAPAEVKLVPTNDYIKFDSTATTGKAGSRDTVWIDRHFGSNTLQIGGSVPLDAKVTRRKAAVTMQDPRLYTASVFAVELAKQGIQIGGTVKGSKAPADAKPVASHTSPPLSEIVRLLNKPSDNLIAEMLLKTLGAALRGRGSSSAGGEVEKEFAGKIGMDLSQLSIADGSGLSRLDYISPQNLVTLLSYMSTAPNSKIFVDSLPIAGVDGTLRYRMTGTAAGKNVKAKTGTVAYVSTLSGYVNTKSGEPLVFSIMMNHAPTPKSTSTRIQDEICRMLAEMP